MIPRVERAVICRAAASSLAVMLAVYLVWVVLGLGTESSSASQRRQGRARGSVSSPPQKWSPSEGDEVPSPVFEAAVEWILSRRLNFTVEEAERLRPLPTTPAFFGYHATLTQADIAAALDYPRQCDVQVRLPLPAPHLRRPGNVTTSWAEGDALLRCIHQSDFLDDCGGRKVPYLGGALFGPGVGAEWRTIDGCAWRSGVEPQPLTAMGKQIGLAAWKYNRSSSRHRTRHLWGCSTGEPCGGTGTPCTCWLHSHFYTPNIDRRRYRDILLPPRVGGRFATWDAIPDPESLLRSRSWAADVLGLGVTAARPTTVVIIGHSHARVLFSSLASVVRDVVDGTREVDIRYDETTDDSTLTLDGLPVVEYVATASPAQDDIDRASRVARTSFGGVRGPDVIIVARGMWELENADDGPHQLFLNHVQCLQSLRAAFAEAMIFNYNTHFVHSVHGGCMSALQQVVARDAIACAVARANDRGARIETFDIFDVTATRFVGAFGFRALSEAFLAAAAAVANNRSACDAVKQRIMPLAATTVINNVINGVYVAPVSDGHHYDSPVALNIVFALLIQINATVRAMATHGNGSSAGLPYPSGVRAGPRHASSVTFPRDPVQVPAPALANMTCRRCYEGVTMKYGLFAKPWCEALRRRRFVSCNLTNAHTAAARWHSVAADVRGTADPFVWLAHATRRPAGRSAASRGDDDERSVALNNASGAVKPSDPLAGSVLMGIEGLRCSRRPNPLSRSVRAVDGGYTLRIRAGPPAAAGAMVALPGERRELQRWLRNATWMPVSPCMWPSARKFAWMAPHHRIFLHPFEATTPRDACWLHNSVPEDLFSSSTRLDVDRLLAARAVFVGNSHLRFAFLSLAGLLRDLVHQQQRNETVALIFPIHESDFSVLCITPSTAATAPSALTASCSEHCHTPIMVYVPTPIPSLADIESYRVMSSSRREGESTNLQIPPSCLVPLSSVTHLVTASGPWEATHSMARATPESRRLQRLRERTEAYLTALSGPRWLAPSTRVVFAMFPAPRLTQGCMSVDRLLRFREPILDAIASVNEAAIKGGGDRRTVLVWDFFALSATRSVRYPEPDYDVQRLPVTSPYDIIVHQERTVNSSVSAGDFVHMDMPLHLSPSLMFARFIGAPISAAVVVAKWPRSWHATDATPVVLMAVNATTLGAPYAPFDAGTTAFAAPEPRCSVCDRPDSSLWFAWCPTLRRREAVHGCADGGNGPVTVADVAFAHTPPRKTDQFLFNSTMMEEMALAVASLSTCTPPI